MCIYCKQSAPTVEPSIAHVFPDAMGGTEFTKDSVCRGCNHLVNQRVEMPALDAVVPLQSLFNIRGRRNKIRRVRGTFKARGQETIVYVNERGELTDAVVIENTDPDGKKRLSIFGPREYVEQKLREMGKPNEFKWEEAPILDGGVVEVEFANSDTLAVLRRLAAKVALERFAQLRSAAFVTDREYDNVRDFILTGTDTTHCAGVIVDQALLEGIFGVFQPPHHAVYIVSHPEDRTLGAFIVFYGLFYYWVILSRRYRALGPMDDLLLQDPQAREAENPRLRAKAGAARFNWQQISAPSIVDPMAADKAAGKHAVAKFRAAADAFYGPNGEDIGDNAPR